jgi:hypothetical protein
LLELETTCFVLFFFFLEVAGGTLCEAVFCRYLFFYFGKRERGRGRSGFFVVLRVKEKKKKRDIRWGAKKEEGGGCSCRPFPK